MPVKRAIFTAVVALLTSALTSPADAETSITSSNDQTAVEMTAMFSQAQNAERPIHPKPGQPVAAPLVDPAVDYPLIVWDGLAGHPCTVYAQMHGLGGAVWVEVNGTLVLAHRGYCPGAAAPAVSPGAAAAQIWRDRVQLPVPDPYVAPGKAIVGKNAYLEVRGEHAATPPPFSAFGYSITVSAVVDTYSVNWGDGSPVEHHSNPGGPWPDGSIRHAFDNAGTYTITVTENWSGRYSVAGGPSGAVPGLLHTVGRFTLRADQVQAVRN